MDEERKEEEKLIALSEVAARLGVEAVTIRAWLMRGKIQGKKLGRDWFFTESQIAARIISKQKGRPRKK